MTVVAGIDPGLSGAIAILSNGQYEYVCDMPVLKSESGKRYVDAVELASILCSWEPDLVVIENVHAMPKQGVTSTFTFGESFGVIKGVVGALNYQSYLVSPKVWKKAAGLIKQDKEASRQLAIDMFGDAPLSRKRDNGRAEALLIGYYGAPMMARGPQEFNK